MAWIRFHNSSNHGGTLINRKISDSEIEGLSSFQSLELSYNYLIDAEQIATGTYSPLTGFMDKKHSDLYSPTIVCRVETSGHCRSFCRCLTKKSIGLQLVNA